MTTLSNRTDFKINSNKSVKRAFNLTEKFTELDDDRDDVFFQCFSHKLQVDLNKKIWWKNIW